MGDLYCPYCEADLGGYVDDCHEQDTEYEHQCPKCEKNFMFTINYQPMFSSQKAPCLNGGEHEWEEICGLPKEFFIDKYSCKYCGKKEKIKSTTKVEKITALTGSNKGGKKNGI